MDWLVILCVVAAMAGGGYGWYSEARKEADEMRKRIVDGRSAA